MPSSGSRTGTSTRSVQRHRQERKDQAQQQLGKLLRGAKAAAVLGLGMTDAEGAARFVLGFDPAEDDAGRKKEVRELAKLARSKKMQPFREGQTSAHARLASTALGLALAHAIESTPTVPPQSTAMHTKMLYEVSERLGGSDAMFSEIVYELSVTVVD